MDAYEHQVLKGGTQNDAGDEVPAFYEWATIQPGMLTLARKKRTAQYRQFHAAGENLPAVSPAHLSTAHATFPPAICRNRDARHRLRRVPDAEGREGLLLLGCVPLEDRAHA